MTITMPYIRFLSLLIIALLHQMGCNRVPDAEIAARVNGQIILKKDFNIQVEHSLARFRGQNAQLPPGIASRIEDSVLRRMIDDELINQKSRSLNITITNEEVDRRFKEHKERFRTEQAFDDYLKRSNNTEANLKEDLRHSLLRDQVIDKLIGNVEISDAEIQKYYDDNTARFLEKEEIQAKRILISVDPNAKPAEKKKAKHEADKILALVKKPGADFGAIAKVHSKGPEAGRDGDLGMFGRNHMSPEFDKVAFALKPGEVSSVVETKLGYEIILLQTHKPERKKPLEEVRETIQHALVSRQRNDKRRDAMRDLKNNAKIDILVTIDQAPMPAPAPPASPTQQP